MKKIVVLIFCGLFVGFTFGQKERIVKFVQITIS